MWRWLLDLILKLMLETFFVAKFVYECGHFFSVL